jgi:glycosyltransferase involved in cell wall biosynthesis
MKKSKTDIIKILHIVEDLKIGGLEKVIATIALNLNTKRYEVNVWCLAEGGDIASELIGYGVNVKFLGKSSYHNPLSILLLALQLRKEQFDIIHTHGYFAGTFGRLAAILACIPVIITHVHSTYFEYKTRNLLIENFLARFTGRIICVSRAVQKFVTEIEGIKEVKTCVIYNAAGNQKNEHIYLDKGRMKKIIGIDNTDLVIIIVASLTENKGHRILLAAFKRVLLKHPSIRLLIVGDGPLNADLQAATKYWNIEQQVIFTGKRTDIPELLQISDIAALTSLYREGLGISLIEAMAFGLPLIGTSLGGIPELIEDNVNGLLVAPGNVDDLASAIETLVTKRDLRERMGQKSKLIYEEKFTVSRMMKEIETLYEQLLDT